MRTRLATGIGLIAAGGAILGLAVAARPQSVPQSVPRSAARPALGPAPRPAPAQAGTTGPAAHGPILPRSLPVSISIPVIGVRSALLDLGRNPDGTIQVPPLDDPSLTNEAAWYEFSPTPGQPGASIIEGHVDSARDGPSVFFRLGALRPGDLVGITLADRQVAVFRITGVRLFPKDRFPSGTVYSGGGTGSAELRLITCGGDFDARDHRYLSNVVAFASLVSSSPVPRR